MKKIVLQVLVGALILTGCSSKTTTSDNMTDNASTISVPGVDASTFQSKIIGRGVVVLDVRTADEFSKNHLIDARNMDVESADFDTKMVALDKSVTYAIYCQSGRRSAIAYNKMKDAGFKSLLNLEGGMEAWMSAGLPMVGMH